MHWLYHLSRSQPAQCTVAQEVYLRAVKPGMEKAENRLVSQIIHLQFFALDYYFALADNPLDTEEGRHIYQIELSKKSYFIQELNVDEAHEHLMARAIIYLKTDRFDEPELLEWVKVYLSVEGLDHDTFEKTDLSSFPEMNAILSLFSLENVQKFEDQLGKEWWKGNSQPTANDQPPTHPDE